MRESLKKLVVDTGREVEKEWIDHGIWRLQIKHGQKIIFIVHPEKSRFVNVIFPVTFDKKEIKQKFTEVFNKEETGPQAMYLFRSTINNPQSGFYIDRVGNEFTGFQISKNLFPFEKEFSIKDVDIAIQTVVSVGVAGTDYLSTLLGNVELKQKAMEGLPKTDPENMFQ